MVEDSSSLPVRQQGLGIPEIRSLSGGEVDLEDAELWRSNKGFQTLLRL